MSETRENPDLARVMGVRMSLTEGFYKLCIATTIPAFRVDDYVQLDTSILHRIGPVSAGRRAVTRRTR